MTLFFIISIILPLALALILTPLVIRLALKVNAIDQPDKRKVHKRPIPRLGGLAVAGSFLISIGLLFVIIPEFFPAVIPFTFQPEASVLFSVAAGAVLLIILLGVRDDVKPLSPGFKFVIQIVAATFAWFAGFNITFVGDPFGTGIINLEQLSLPLTVLWIVGVTNAFNLIDGLDGLASGTAIIALTAIGMISIIHGQLEILLFCLILGLPPMGFLDEDPEIEGKHINGLPVFGGHWKLEHLIRKYGIQRHFLSGDQLNSEICERIESLRAACDLKLKKFRVDFSEIPFTRPKLTPMTKDKVIYAKY